MALTRPFSIVMLGATGAVGSQVVSHLLQAEKLERLTLLGRRPLDIDSTNKVEQHAINIFEPAGYREYLTEHSAAICTLGVGQPSKISREDFIKIDKLAVLDFARECKLAGVRHFQLLGSLASSSKSWSFFLRTKGELEDELRALDFERLSLFQPSMILTPSNRYGLMQGLTLKIWPLLHYLLVGPLRKYRGIRVERLGKAFAQNAQQSGLGVETLHWDHFLELTQFTGAAPHTRS